MPKFKVTWTIDIEEDSAVNASLAAWDVVRRHDTSATLLELKEEGVGTWTVDVGLPRSECVLDFTADSEPAIAKHTAFHYYATAYRDGKKTHLDGIVYLEKAPATMEEYRAIKKMIAEAGSGDEARMTIKTLAPMGNAPA